MAIVLPNGLLNNSGLACFRRVILAEAQILAVVDMHRDLFQPRNDTQTSMVLLRKWGVGENAESHGDYPIFMAVADHVGHDKRGRTTYKRNADGSLLWRDISTLHKVPTSSGGIEEVEVQTTETNWMRSPQLTTIGWLLRALQSELPLRRGALREGGYSSSAGRGCSPAL